MATRNGTYMKFYIERLGCPKNDVDADYIAGRLIDDGHQQVDSADDASAVIVNTCGFILPAKQESIGELLRFGEMRKDGQLKRLIAAGCLSQRHGADLLEGIPEIDLACGLGELDALSAALGPGAVDGNGATTPKRSVVETRNLSYLAGSKRFIDSNVPYAYLKISDGCDRKCSYCVIPKMRGSFRSRSIEDIVTEAEQLAEAGKKELILVSQEATLFGCETGKTQILELLQELEGVSGIEWIRLLYLHPQALGSDLIDYLSNGSKVLPYYDLPLQHISDSMLSRMRRQVRRAKIERVLAEIQEKSSNAIIRTTFIVGFPGETEEDFGELMDFASEFEFDRMGAFAYSKEDGSSSALMPDQIPEALKEERVVALNELQTTIAQNKNAGLIGRRERVLIDSVGQDMDLVDANAPDGRKVIAVGRTMGDCPDIDHLVYLVASRESSGGIEDGTKLKDRLHNSFCDAEVCDTVGVDLVAEIAVN